MPAGTHRGAGRHKSLGGYTPFHGKGAKSMDRRSKSMERSMRSRWDAFLKSWER